MSSYFSSRMVFFFSLFAVSIFVSLVFSPISHAAYDDLPGQLPTVKDIGSNAPEPHQYVHLSLRDNDYGSGIGDAGANLPSSYMKYYIENANKSGTREFFINVVSRVRPERFVCENYKIHWRVISLDANETPSAAVDQGDIRVNGCAANSNYPSYSGYRFSFDSSSLTRSNIPGHRNLATAVIQFTIDPDSSYATEPMSSSFTLKASGGRLGYAASSRTYQTGSYSTVDSSASPASGWGVNVYPSLSGTSESSSRSGPYGTGPGENKPQHTISQKFGVPCEYTGPGTVTVRFKDADRGSSVQDNNLGVSVKRFGPSLSYLDTQNPAVTWANGSGVGSFQIDIQAGYNYRIDFEKVEGGNALGLYYPFDSGDFNLNCPTTSPSTGDASCDNIVFNVPSGGVANRAYKVYFKSRSGSGGAVGDPAIINSSYKIADSTAASGASNVTVPVKDRYISGYYEYEVIVYNGADDTTGRDTNFASDGSLYGDQGPCYTAACNVKASSALGDGKAVAGQQFYVSVKITNTGTNRIPSPRNYSGSDKFLSATLALDGKWTPNPNNGSVAGLSPIYPDLEGPFVYPGEDVYAGFYLTAPSGQAVHDVRVYPDYWLLGEIGPLCTGSASAVTTYERYDFTATASSTLNPDEESPTSAGFVSTLTQGGVAVDGTSTRSFSKDRAGVVTPLPGYGPFTEGVASFGGRNYNTDSYVLPAGSYVRGDRYCVSISLDRGHGWRSGSDYMNDGPVEASNCGPKVVDRPYVRTYGADVAVGCANNKGIYAFMRPISDQSNPGPNKSGSGAQMAVMALNQITGFTSASTRTAAPAAPRGLTFANNNPVTPSNTLDAHLGGGAASNGWCAPNFYDETQYPDGSAEKTKIDNSTADVTVSGLSDKHQTLVNTPTGTGTLKLIGNGAANFANHHTVYVNGNVFILNNIMYTTDYSAGLAAIPSFALVVKGNIYIDNDVTQLDGLYVAQSNGTPNSGRIYTCGTEGQQVPANGPMVDPALMFTSCGASGAKRQLMVNGAFIADRVILNRSGYSLRDSTLREPAGSSKAAEIFNFSGEMYLSPPFFSPRTTFTSGDYQYIATLPPIL